MKRFNPVSTNDITYKILLIGDSAAGKTSLLLRYTTNFFQQDHNLTIGVQFGTKQILIDNEKKVTIQIWDSAGQEQYRSIVKSFYRNSTIVMLVYKITSQRSFDSLDFWVNQAVKYAPKDSLFVLIGTHSDLESQRQVSKQQAQKFAKQHFIDLIFETSARQNINITEVFEESARKVYEHQLNKKLQQNTKKSLSFQIQKGPNLKSKVCC